MTLKVFNKILSKFIQTAHLLFYWLTKRKANTSSIPLLITENFHV